MRKLLMLWLGCALGMVLGAAAASAQPITLSDGKYSSPNEFLAGTWKWERQDPRATMVMRFERGGGFYYQNVTTELQHWGSYTASSTLFHVSITRTCEDQGRKCTDRDPPLVVEEPFSPVSADVFMSASERWTRQK